MSLPPDWTSLKIFVAACETRSVARAAEVCAIASSTAARRIQDMEVRLGVSLFVRTARGVEMTPAGEVLLEQARIVLEAGRDLMRQMEALSANETSVVRLEAATSAISGHDLSGMISSFSKQLPGIKVELRESSSREIINNIVSGAADIGIATLRERVPDALSAETWRADNLVAVLPSSHPLADRETVKFSQLIDEPLVGIVPNDTLALTLEEAAARLGRRLVVGFRVATSDAALHLVTSGQGVSIMPDSVVRASHRTRQEIAIVELEETWAKRTLYVIGPAHQSGVSTAARLRKHLLLTS